MIRSSVRRGASWLVVATLICAGHGAHAWGGEGHRIVGAIAQTKLMPSVRIKVSRLLNGESLVDASTWMDDVRDDRTFDFLKSWHYTKVPVCASPRVFCKDGNCALERVKQAVSELRGGDPRQQAFAIRVVAHLVGDIHQPLHSSDNHDAGGNAVEVVNRKCGPKGCDLHTYWDSQIVKGITRGKSSDQVVSDLLNEYQGETFDRTFNPNLWTSESNTLARNVAYNIPGINCDGGHQRAAVSLDAAYDEKAKRAVAAQLVKAGLRLATVLNESLR